MSRLDDLIRQASNEWAAMVERACEEALQSGKHGVRIRDGRAFVDETVPYGMIYDEREYWW